MKIIELTKDLRIPVTNEEYSLLRMVGDTSVEKRTMDARQQHIANQLVNKDLLNRTNQDGTIYYTKKTGS